MLYLLLKAGFKSVHGAIHMMGSHYGTILIFQGNVATSDGGGTAVISYRRDSLITLQMVHFILTIPVTILKEIWTGCSTWRLSKQFRWSCICYIGTDNIYGCSHAIEHLRQQYYFQWHHKNLKSYLWSSISRRLLNSV